MNLNALKQTVALEQHPCRERKKKAMMGKRKREEGVEEERDGDGGKRRSESGVEKSQKPPHNNTREKSEHFPPKDGPFPNPCALSDKLK